VLLGGSAGVWTLSGADGAPATVQASGASAARAAAAAKTQPKAEAKTGTTSKHTSTSPTKTRVDAATTTATRPALAPVAATEASVTEATATEAAPASPDTATATATSVASSTTQSARVDALAPLTGHVRIMPLGDSITYGIGSSTRNGYRADLAARLAAAGVDVDFVGTQRNGTGDADHEGHPGWRIDEVRNWIDDWMAAAQPDVVLLNIGTNDYVQNFDPELAPARLSDLIDRILVTSPTTRVVVARLLVSIGEKRARGIAAFDAAVPGIVAAKGPRVTVADMSRVPNRNTVDGLHPNDLGYRQMSYQWFEALRPVLGGRAWPAPANPFPLPAVRLARSSATVAQGRAVTLTAQLSGVLTSTDLGRVPVKLMYKRVGTSRWVAVRSGLTAANGKVAFRQQLTRTGQFTVRVSAGRAAGRQSLAVRVAAVS
jgi:lysophospholipase L1-like esterase